MPDCDFSFDRRLASAATLPSWCYTRADVLENGVHHFHSLLARALRGD